MRPTRKGWGLSAQGRQMLKENIAKAKESVLDMYLTTARKKELFKTYGGSESNTGSAEGQIALFTERILHLSEHVRNNRNDRFTQRSLVSLVGKRRRMLDYLKEVDIERYRAIVQKLGLRK